MDLEGLWANRSQAGRGRSWHMRSHLGQMRADVQGNTLTSQEETQNPVKQKRPEK